MVVVVVVNVVAVVVENVVAVVVENVAVVVVVENVVSVVVVAVVKIVVVMQPMPVFVMDANALYPFTCSRSAGNPSSFLLYLRWPLNPDVAKPVDGVPPKNFQRSPLAITEGDTWMTEIPTPLNTNGGLSLNANTCGSCAVALSSTSAPFSFVVPLSFVTKPAVFSSCASNSLCSAFWPSRAKSKNTRIPLGGLPPPAVATYVLMPTLHSVLVGSTSLVYTKAKLPTVTPSK